MGNFICSGILETLFTQSLKTMADWLMVRRRRHFLRLADRERSHFVFLNAEQFNSLPRVPLLLVVGELFSVFLLK